MNSVDFLLTNKHITYEIRTEIKRLGRPIPDLIISKTDDIAEYAEFLSYHRSNESLSADSSYDYFNADNLTNTERNPEVEKKLSDNILEDECLWMCQQAELGPLPNNIFSDKMSRAQLFIRRKNEQGDDCNCDSDQLSPIRDYLSLPLEYDYRFDDNVNLNLSITKVAMNVYERESAVLEGVRWSEPLDLVFKNNFIRDPTLTWQYFASPRGFMRHYPAVQWSKERYDRTYDFRTRTWYTEAITSPKDIVILLDKSGSMEGTRRAMSMQIVNQILDTLNDNDFFNIYTFANTTEPVVSCFSDTLVQANEENLRLFRENLPVYIEKFAANLTLGFEKAFEILENFTTTKTSANCNQAIMIITEGIDYSYNKDFFKTHNEAKKFPVRIFTYQIGADEGDAKELEWIACFNKGWWANITDMGDIREKMLNYLNVMSRPINLNRDNKSDRKYIWSYLHVDLADRRLSNWLWKKYEGIRQRQVFLDHVKRKTFRLGQFFTSSSHMLLQDTHEYEEYEKEINYKYMTTVSLPVYGRREDEIDLIGVAGIDVPLTLFKALIDYQRLGVNGYAFIVTNNGYVLMHPDHRTQFKKILKPTFNRVDIVEVEILDDDNDPRLFGEAIVKLREKLVSQNESGEVSLNVKYSLHDMKRLMLGKRHYFYAPVGPFTLGIVLPDRYGFVKINRSDLPPQKHGYEALLDSNWKAHPDWIYCNSCKNEQQEDKVKKAFAGQENSNLLNSFIYDLDATRWFNSAIDNEEKFIRDYIVHKVFLATYSGLFRWKTLKDITESEHKSFEERNNEAVDEDWYRRAVELNFKNESFYIYSVPFETSGYENNTVITSTKAIFVEKDGMKTPVAVVGLQFNHRAMYRLYNVTTKQCVDQEGKACNYTCESDYLNCFILDNNAYVVLSDDVEFIGRYMGDIRPDIMARLTDESVYTRKRMFDYQAICQKTPPESAGRIRMRIRHHRPSVDNMELDDEPGTYTVELENEVYQSTKDEFLAFEKLAINKTFPTPCDHDMWLYNFNESKNFPYAPFSKVKSKPYVVDRIPNTNLLFLAINGDKPCTKSDAGHKAPEPREILYRTSPHRNVSLPCYIAINNNYTRRMYMGCFNRDEKEYDKVGMIFEMKNCNFSPFLKKNKNHL
ncbi:hypothetical protein NQ318_010787 [Aromia moschata]|uniref:VWFA domain-containing protein n=1 Tax=Aromia moschata TaxID=1265417 RepID=A0AAV8XDD1_9CUCU|nr:hypothetical protein NQ318_010787 [Aromia moschata]